MPKKVLFVYHYDRDMWRANRVLKSWQTRGTWEPLVITDLKAWQNLKVKGSFSLQKWFMTQLDGTSATVVLYGPETSKQLYVKQVLEESAKRGNGIISIAIHGIRDQDLKLDLKGLNPVDSLTSVLPPAGRYVHQDWVSGSGETNLDTWLKKVAKK